MSHELDDDSVVVKVKRESVTSCMTCPLCRKLLRHATTITECLHTFCRKCIYNALSDEEKGCCPICNIYLGSVPLEKLRADHNIQDVRAKIFPYKKIKIKAPEIMASGQLQVKRKEISLSSLVVSTPKVSTQSGMTGRRSKSTARKASKGPNFTIVKTFKKENDLIDDHLGSSSSLENLNEYNQKRTQNSASTDPTNQHALNKKKAGVSNTLEEKDELLNPTNCLVETAKRMKSSKFGTQGSVVKSAAVYSHDNERLLKKSKMKGRRFKSKVQDEKNVNGTNLSESEMPKKSRKVRQKKSRNFGDFGVPPQVVLDASCVKSDRRNYPVWFSLVASVEQEGDGLPLPQISANYIRIKDRSTPVSFVQKYLKAKLNLTTEDEVEIKFMGEAVIPSLTLNNLVDLWLQTTTTERVSATIGSCAKDFVMPLGYARRVPDS